MKLIIIIIIIIIIIQKIFTHVTCSLYKMSILTHIIMHNYYFKF
jgi:hypothetical protein